MIEPSKDETPQTFGLLGREILAILVSLQTAPPMIRHEISRMLGRPYKPGWDFAGAREAIFAQRESAGPMKDMTREEFSEATFEITLPRRLWIACYHALVWTRPGGPEGELRLKISMDLA